MELFSIKGKVAIVTGGTGVLGGSMAKGLAAAGVKVGVLGRRKEEAELVYDEIINAGGESSLSELSKKNKDLFSTHSLDEAEDNHEDKTRHRSG